MQETKFGKHRGECCLETLEGWHPAETLETGALADGLQMMRRFALSLLSDGPDKCLLEQLLGVGNAFDLVSVLGKPEGRIL